MNASMLSSVRKPGMLSSLSIVPPVCPSPRPGHLGYRHAARRYQRRDDQRGGVADAARGMLVHAHAGDIR